MKHLVLLLFVFFCLTQCENRPLPEYHLGDFGNALFAWEQGLIQEIQRLRPVDPEQESTNSVDQNFTFEEFSQYMQKLRVFALIFALVFMFLIFIHVIYIDLVARGWVV
ncbi:hypothetical protein CRE_31261 [Caenorhabditis remanei]|uniref:Uncharacterized protein n=1 Tax=Caenorhabditis remanei TaxID=31234 RepID=E3MLH7_CAERE|nr:hypothetical protein CRE_31261 [Caenorhabditis remanei]